MLLLLFFVVRPFISVSFLLSSCSHIVNFKNKNRNCHLQSRTVQTCCPYSYRYRKQWDIKLEAQGWKIGHRLRYSARSLQWTMICRVKNDMWAGLFSVRVWNIVTALQASVIVGFLITDFKQIFNILKLLQQMSYMCNFHITPTVPFFFFFWPTLLLSPSIRCHTSRLTSGASSLWPIILYPHWLQTITTEANSSLFPLSAVSLLIFNKKKVFVSSMKKIMSPTFKLCSFILYTSSYCQCDCSVLVCNESVGFIAAVDQSFSPLDPMWVSFKTQNWTKHRGDTKVQQEPSSLKLYFTQWIFVFLAVWVTCGSVDFPLF